LSNLRGLVRSLQGARIIFTDINFANEKKSLEIIFFRGNLYTSI